jgi:hypothetical protein
MKGETNPDVSSSAIEIIEEAVHLVRSAPMPALVCYLAGSLPFLLGFLYFWLDMSASHSAAERLPVASIGLALAFVWMKFWDAIFAMRLRALAACRDFHMPGWKECLTTACGQSAIHAAGLFLIPLAAIAVVPFPWVYAFFQHATACPAPEKGLRQTVTAAWAMTTTNITETLHLAPLMSGFSLVVLINWISLGVLAPELVRMLLGVDTHPGFNVFAMLNSTFLAIACALTCLSVDPILKALHVLRGHRAECVSTGEDLAADLRRIRRNPSSGPALAILLAATCVFASPGRAAETTLAEPAPPSTKQESLDPARLGQAIDETLAQPKYQWRTPREKRSWGMEDNVVSRFFSDALKTVRKILRPALQWIEDLLDRLFPKREAHGDSSWTWMFSSQVLLWLLLAAVLIILALALLRWKFQRRGPTAEAAPLQPAPNLDDETVGADQMPVDGWMRLGRELLDKGELRLALRAFYLSSLALLAERQLITLARFKSNRDYERELRRRGHELASLPALFSGNVEMFDHAWYGSLRLDEPSVRRFADSVQQMRVPA